MDVVRLEDLYHGRLACILTNANRDTEQQPDPWPLEDFLLIEPAEGEHKEQTPEDMLVMVQALNAFYGGTVEVNDN